MEAVKKFIAERGFTLMLAGMLTLLAGALLYSYIQYSPARFTGLRWMLPLSGVMALTGLIVYVVGRVSVGMQRRRARNKPKSGDDDGEL